MLTVEQLSILLNVKQSWIRQQVFKKKIPFVKVNRLIRFDKDSIQYWLKQNEVNSLLIKGELNEHR